MDLVYPPQGQGIKGLFSKQYKKTIKPEIEISDSMMKKREAGIYGKEDLKSIRCNLWKIVMLIISLPIVVSIKKD